MTTCYDIIYADPPWFYKRGAQFNKTNQSVSSANQHYPCMTKIELQNYELPPTNKDALLFMWSSSPHLQEAIELGQKWGFEYITIAFVWDKQVVNVSYYTMSQIEICLVFKKGRIPKPRGARNIRQLVSEKRTRHSAKPAEVRNRITLMFPKQNKIELFARERVQGWDAVGNEI